MVRSTVILLMEELKVVAPGGKDTRWEEKKRKRGYNPRFTGPEGILFGSNILETRGVGEETDEISCH